MEDEEYGIRDFPFIPTSLFAETPFGAVLIPYLLPRADAVDNLLNELTIEERMLLTVGASHFLTPAVGAVIDGMQTESDALDAAQEGDSEGMRNILLLGGLGFLLGETPLPEAVVNRIGRVVDSIEDLAHTAVTIQRNVFTLLSSANDVDDVVRLFSTLDDAGLRQVLTDPRFFDTLANTSDWMAVERYVRMRARFFSHTTLPTNFSESRIG